MKISLLIFIKDFQNGHCEIKKKKTFIFFCIVFLHFLLQEKNQAEEKNIKIVHLV